MLLLGLKPLAHQKRKFSVKLEKKVILKGQMFRNMIKHVQALFMTMNHLGLALVNNNRRFLKCINYKQEK